jgi:uncharacterized protein (TIRG00374 family)
MAEAVQRGGGRSLSQALILVAKCALAAALVAWLLWSGRLDLGHLTRIRAGGAMLGVLAGQLIVLVTPLFRWALLLRTRKLAFTPRQITQIGLISYFAVLILPATGGQEAVRLFYASRLKPGRGADILSTLVLDRFVGLLGLCALAVTSGLILVARTRSDAVLKIVGLGGALLIALSVITVFLLRTKPERVRAVVDRFGVLSALFRSLEEFKASWGVLLTSLALSLVAHFGSCLSMYFGFLAVGAPVSLVEACAITPLVTLTSILPVTPLGIGVADTVADTLFTLVGARGGAEVTMLVRVVTAVMCLACGLAYLVPLPASEPGEPPREPDHKPNDKRDED